MTAIPDAQSAASFPDEHALHALREGRDPLTGALGRERLHDELARAIAAAGRYDEPAAICIVDLDNFRLVNEVHGHAAGDRLLGVAAAAIQERLRTTDALGRIGSDEFAIVLPRTDLDAARAVADELLGALRERARVGPPGEESRITASIGIAPIAPGRPLAPTELLAEADLAMVAAKQAGRDRIMLADPVRDGQARSRASLSWASRIREALETGGLELHAQPIVSLAEGGAAERFELLVRLRDSTAEPVAPSEFLPTAERFGQMQAIDGWVLARALDLLARTQDTVFHVNLAPASIGDAELMTFIERAVIGSEVDPARLVVEITESAAIADLPSVRLVVDRLRGLGCAMALDDFGSGFGSFSYLKHLPFDVLKIDGEFVVELPTSLVDRLSVGAIADVARGLGMITVAEYVSDDDTIEILREIGVDYAQGHHLGRPVAVNERWSE